MKIITKETLPISTRQSILYKGPSGSRKTPNAFSWPKPIIAAYFDVNRKNVDQMIRAGDDIQLMIPESWAEFEREFVTPVYHRKFEAQTIIVDTIDFAAAMLMREIQGAKQKMVMQDWGKLLTDLTNVCNKLVSSTGQHGDLPAYNVVFCSHEGDVTDDGGNLLKTTPKIPGSFKYDIESFFDTVLICEAQLASKVVEGKITRSKEFICHSIPTSKYQTAKGTNLPPLVDGMYDSLRKEWDSGNKE